MKWSELWGWQQWFSWTEKEVSELSVQPVLYLGFISIHSLSLLAPPAQDTSFIPATQIKQSPTRVLCSLDSVPVTHCFSHSLGRLFICCKKSADMYIKKKIINPAHCWVNPLPIHTAWKHCSHCPCLLSVKLNSSVSIEEVCPEVSQAFVIFMMYLHYWTRPTKSEFSLVLLYAFSVSFQIQGGGAQWTHANKPIIIPLFMDLPVHYSSIT